MTRWLKRAADLFFPPVCIGCGTLLDWYGGSKQRTAFCESCEQKWENERLETCGICTAPIGSCACVTETMERANCAAFRKLVYYCPGNREKVQSRVIYRMKDRCTVQIPRFLASQLLVALRELVKESEASPQDLCIAYVPRSRRAIAEHGTDQAKLLAKALSEMAEIPLCHAILRQRRQNRPQKSLTLSERMQNAKQAFMLSKNGLVKGKTVFLVDDIVTTGASMAACAKLLRRAGAKRVYCLAVASDDVNRDRAQKIAYGDFFL